MKRIRKHANPFHVRVEVGRLDRAALFGREGPIEVELGAGNGSFLIERAGNEPAVDFVGFEIRRPLVDAANVRARERGLGNVVFLYANALSNLAPLADPGVVRRFHVHFPDPCFKTRHMKRRLLSPQVARTMGELLPMDGEVYAQSDVKPLAEEMFDFLTADGAFASVFAKLEVPRPIAESTAWERQHEREGAPIYRLLFKKVRSAEGPVSELSFRRMR